MLDNLLSDRPAHHRHWYDGSSSCHQNSAGSTELRMRLLSYETKEKWFGTVLNGANIVVEIGPPYKMGDVMFVNYW